MIKLAFTVNREVIKLTIDSRSIFYSDRMWKKNIRLIPKDEDFMRKVKLSRNKIPDLLIDLFELTKEEEKEYLAAKDDNALAEICIKDMGRRGGKLINRTNK